MKLLFVCLGNICRSPSAEAIMNQLIEDAGLADKISCDSAGTIGYHEGLPADARMRKHGNQRGLNLDSISRQVTATDFKAFDYIIAMDRSNYNDLLECAKTEVEKRKVFQICDYASEPSCNEIPDPYYGGSKGFEKVLDLLEGCCGNLLTDLKQKI